MAFLLLFMVMILSYSLWKFFLKPRYALNSQEFYFVSQSTQSNKKEEDFQALSNELTNADKKLFDSVAKLMFEKAINNHNVESAQHIQYEFFNKMPIQAQSQINQFDLNEWSIYWTFKSQSIEYYCSKYGVFYTHVDAEGIEHKLELKNVA